MAKKQWVSLIKVPMLFICFYSVDFFPFVLFIFVWINKQKKIACWEMWSNNGKRMWTFVCIKRLEKECKLKCFQCRRAESEKQRKYVRSSGIWSLWFALKWWFFEENASFNLNAKLNQNKWFGLDSTDAV